MDKADRRILSYLSRDGRISFAALGREIGLSRPAVQERVARLERAGIIRGYRADLGDAGLIEAVVLVKIAQRPCDAALAWMAGLEGVIEAVSISGEYDAILRCLLPDAEALSALNDTLAASDLIAQSVASLVMKRA